MRLIETVVGHGCTHNTYNNGIHEYFFSAVTKEAIDTWIDFSLEHYKQLAEEDKLLILFDSSHAGTPPLGYTISRVKVLLAHRPPQLVTRTALVVLPNPVNNLARTLSNNMLRDVGNARVRFFSPKERDDAIAWLLQE